jgi:hypothetical protein
MDEMRTLTAASALLCMVISLQAKEADSLRGLRSPDAAVKQFVSDQSVQSRSKPAKTKSDGRKDRDFSADAIVPDICTGC